MYQICNIDQLSYYFEDKAKSCQIVIDSFIQGNIDSLDSIYKKYLSRKTRYDLIIEKLEKERIGRIETEYDFDQEMRSDMEEERDEVYDDDNGDTP